MTVPLERGMSAQGRGPAGQLDTELLGVLGVEALPAAELHRVGADHASDGRTGEQPVQHVETDVPARGAHRDETTVDVVPERQPGAAGLRLQLPANVLPAPVELQQ